MPRSRGLATRPSAPTARTPPASCAAWSHRRATYLRTREQFGVAIGSFQALQHRFADMHMAALEANAMAREMARAIDTGDTARIQWLRYAAPTVVARCGGGWATRPSRCTAAWGSPTNW